jgi:hypothetical protein
MATEPSHDNNIINLEIVDDELDVTFGSLTKTISKAILFETLTENIIVSMGFWVIIIRDQCCWCPNRLYNGN